MTTVTTAYLELTDPGAIVPAKAPPPATVLVRAELPSPELARYFYTGVGGDWFWRDRLAWDWAAWYGHLDRPGYELWYATREGTPVGYFELDGTSPPNVEIVTFGLLPAFIGQGLGGWLLEAALRRGFELGSRVWLHTCSLDHPSALAAYQARGLAIYTVEHGQQSVPDDPPGPWAGADRPSPRTA